MLGAFLIACGSDAGTPQGPSTGVKTMEEWINVSGTQEFVYDLKPEWKNRNIKGFKLTVGVRFHQHQNNWIQGFNVKNVLRGVRAYVPVWVSSELMQGSGTQVSSFDPASNSYTCIIYSRNTTLQVFSYKKDRYSDSEWSLMHRSDTAYDPAIKAFKVIIDWTRTTIKFTITDAQILTIAWEPIF